MNLAAKFIKRWRPLIPCLFLTIKGETSTSSRATLIPPTAKGLNRPRVNSWQGASASWQLAPDDMLSSVEPGSMRQLLPTGQGCCWAWHPHKLSSGNRWFNINRSSHARGMQDVAFPLRCSNIASAWKELSGRNAWKAIAHGERLSLFGSNASLS